MIILTDVDDVLLSYASGFQQHYGLRTTNINATTFSQAFNIDPVLEKQMVVEFSEHEAFGRLQPIHGAVEAVREIASSGVRFVAISSCGSSTRTLELRKQNLYDLFGDVFLEVNAVPLWHSKENYLAQYKDSGLLWLEDNVNNYIAGENLGLHSVLLKTMYNRPLPNMRVMPNWEQLQEYIRSQKAA